jgi:hypothetical protein
MPVFDPTDPNPSAESERSSAGPSQVAETPLRPDLLDGLDLAGCVRLRQHGIDCVEDLAAVEPLELARSMETGITRVMRLQFLARRLLLRRAIDGDGADGLREDVLSPSRAVSPHSAPRFSPSETAFLFRTPELERELSSYVPRTGP